MCKCTYELIQGYKKICKGIIRRKNEREVNMGLIFFFWGGGIIIVKWEEGGERDEGQWGRRVDKSAPWVCLH